MQNIQVSMETYGKRMTLRLRYVGIAFFGLAISIPFLIPIPIGLGVLMKLWRKTVYI